MARPTQKKETQRECEDTATEMEEALPVPETAVTKEEREEEWLIADRLLRERGMNPVLAARLILEILEATDTYYTERESSVMRVRQLVRIGSAGLKLQENTVPFRELVRQVLHYKSYRRQRTVKEISQYCHRMFRTAPALGGRRVRDIGTDECKKLIFRTFSTLVMRRKARTILHGIFAYALRRGWCSSNPVDNVELPPATEKPIKALDIRQVQKLLKTALEDKHLPCAAALGFLLWAGIRPNELERLRWENVHFEDRVITIPPTHSKTGGARQVTIHTVLYHWLQCTTSFRLPKAPIVPSSWARRWRELRRDAGFEHWEADILRHTFASYHLRHFRNLEELQIEMGHGTTSLLRTRYISMDNVTKAGAQTFWNLSAATLSEKYADKGNRR